MTDANTDDGLLTRLFELIHLLWAAAGLPLGVALVCYVVYSSYPTTLVLVGCAAAFLLSIFLGYLLARSLRRKSRDRGGMAGAMAVHGTTEPDAAGDDGDDEASG